MPNIEEIQLAQLNMLKTMNEVFEREGIAYFAIDGTALGAIRHKGFIPWDDDIDIAILRSDYNKFLKLQSKLPSNLLIINHTTDSNYPLFYSKVLDVNTVFNDRTLIKYDIPKHAFMDILPWDNIQPSKQLSKKLRVINRKFRRSIYKGNGNLKDKLKFIFYRLLHGFKDSKHYAKQIEVIIKSNSSIECNNWGYAILNSSLSYDDIFPLRKVPFEDTFIYVPNKCEQYLEQTYGNYMQLPPEKDRKSHLV